MTYTAYLIAGPADDQSRLIETDGDEILPIIEVTCDDPDNPGGPQLTLNYYIRYTNHGPARHGDGYRYDWQSTW